MKVKYCIVGAFASAFYVRPRYTKDLDVLVEPSLPNGGKIVKALQAFGFGSLKLTAEDFACEGRFVQLGFAPVRVDLVTSLGSIPFSEIWQQRERGEYGGLKVNFIGLKEFVQSKKIAGRPQVLVDLETLKHLKKGF